MQQRLNYFLTIRLFYFMALMFSYSAGLGGSSSAEGTASLSTLWNTISLFYWQLVLPFFCGLSLTNQLFRFMSAEEWIEYSLG